MQALLVRFLFLFQRRRQLFLTGQTVILLKIEKQILHVRIRQSAGIPAPAQIPHNVHPVSQEVQSDGVPQQRVTGFQFLGDTLCHPHLQDDTRQPVSGLFVQVSKICPEFSRQKQYIVLAWPVFLQKRFVHPAPPSNGAAFLRQLQIGDVVVAHQSVADAVLMDFLW